MAISLIGTPVTASAIDGGNVTVNMPSGIAQNDVAVVQAGVAKNAGAAAVSSGWTQEILTDQSTLARQAWYTKIMGSTPDTDFQFTGSGVAADAACGTARAYRGVDLTNILDAAIQAATANSTNPDPPSITTANPGSLVLVGFTGRFNDPAITAPTGYGNLTNVALIDTNSCTSGAADKIVSAAGAENPATFTAVSTSNHVVHTLALRAAATGQSISVGLASEADSALSIARSKLLALGLSTSTDSALAIARSKLLLLGLASEVDSAFAITRSKNMLVGLATEVDTALAILRSKLKVLGIALETDEALSVTNSTQIVVSISQAIENDSAFAVARLKNRQINIALENELSLAITTVKRYAIGLASETDFALAISRIKWIIIGVGIETDTALPMIISGGAIARVATQGRPSHSDSERSPNISTGVRSVN